MNNLSYIDRIKDSIRFKNVIPLLIILPLLGVSSIIEYGSPAIHSTFKTLAENMMASTPYLVLVIIGSLIFTLSIRFVATKQNLPKYALLVLRRAKY